MCGIAGCLLINEKAESYPLLSARQQMHSRGPDEQGEWLDDNVGFAHVRLSIIDIAEGHQPMHSSDDRYVIVFNGEIYNFRELAEELRNQGAVLQTHSDTEVLLALYQCYQAKMLPKLRGMFAFVIYDKQEQKIQWLENIIEILKT